jgi:hypothetical protein
MGLFEDDELMDAMPDIMANEKTCYTCKHLHAGNKTCDAFPKGIPLKYLTGERTHTSSKRQENDIVWEYDEDQKFLNRETRRNEKRETKVVECGTDQKKADRVERDLTKKGYRVRVTTGDTFPPEFTVIGVR